MKNEAESPAKLGTDYEKALAENISLRKSLGAFYTPESVVDYMVKSSLDRLIENGNDVWKLRICDPSCGGGAFLIGIFEYLRKWHENNLNRPLTVSEKERIVSENIFGVDIDEKAVNVSVKTLYALCGKIEKEIKHNIRHGNSLISKNALTGSLFIDKTKDNYGLYKNAFEWRFEFPEVLDEDGNFVGFDAIIGNPPYIQIQKMGEKAGGIKAMNYSTFVRTGDIYSLFGS